jgi:hypothetical protein
MAELDVKLAATGPDAATLDEVSTALLQHAAVQEYLARTRHQLLSFELLETDRKTTRPRVPNLYRANIYDYTNNRAILVDGRLDDLEAVEVTESGSQPLPTDSEFRTAVRHLMRDEELGPGIREEVLRPYPPMPPLIETELPDGRVERTIAIGLLPANGEFRHEIVGVNMVRRKTVRFESRAPEGAVAHNPICGLPGAFQPTTSRGTPGTVNVTVSQAGTVLWRFQVVRPAASSGTRGSGVELRFVDYRGKRVLYRAHVPILNVLYDGNACGPYRDWQWQEDAFQATGTDVGPGFRLCPTPAQTILDSGADTGNFRGVGIYVKGQEVVLVSEMQAGWYRYISEWRLHADGTIRPRFGFSATNNSCVCTRHHHHAYWRFDFDIRTAGGNRVREFNNPPIVGSSNWHTKYYEIKRYRDPARNRRWRVENIATGEGYTLIPGSGDGVADTYARGDVWILRYRGTEIDDGNNWTGSYTEADLDKFHNWELINNQDVVIWYAGHFTHEPGEEDAGHRVGPDLVSNNW